MKCNLASNRLRMVKARDSKALRLRNVLPIWIVFVACDSREPPPAEEVQQMLSTKEN
jgi:hypothetical protein